MTAMPNPDAPRAERPLFVLRPAPDSRPAPAEAPIELRLVSDLSADQPPLPLRMLRDESPATPRTAGDVVPVADVRPWAATLAVAMFETLHGRRPIGQLTRWVDDRVQSAIAFHRRRTGAAAPARPAALRSIRVQHPRPDATEVSAHLALGGRSYALALRLEVWGDHWLCTAVEF